MYWLFPLFSRSDVVELFGPNVAEIFFDQPKKGQDIFLSGPGSSNLVYNQLDGLTIKRVDGSVLFHLGSETFFEAPPSYRVVTEDVTGPVDEEELAVVGQITDREESLDEMDRSFVPTYPLERIDSLNLTELTELLEELIEALKDNWSKREVFDMDHDVETAENSAEQEDLDLETSESNTILVYNGLEFAGFNEAFLTNNESEVESGENLQSQLESKPVQQNNLTSARSATASSSSAGTSATSEFSVKSKADSVV